MSLLKRGGSARYVVGFQIHWATPRSMSATASVTTSLDASETPSSRRITPASITMPITGATTKRHTSIDTSVGQPQPMLSCQ